MAEVSTLTNSEFPDRTPKWSCREPEPRPPETGELDVDEKVVVERVRSIFEREQFDLTVEQVQMLFQRVKIPFDILGLAGVMLSNGENYSVMEESFLLLWNHTARDEFEGLSPIGEFLRRVEDGSRSEREVRDAERRSRLMISGHDPRISQRLLSRLE